MMECQGPWYTTVCCIAVWCTVLLVYCDGACEFPSYVNKPQGWHFNDPVDHNGKVTTHGPDYDVLEFEFAARSYNYTCITEHSTLLNGVKYIIKDGSSEAYRCIDIQERSVSVIQLWVSRETKPSSDQAGILCEEDSMELNPWLLISKEQLPNEAVVCPISGGHTIEPFNSGGSRIPCDTRKFPARIENGCDAMSSHGTTMRTLGTEGDNNSELPVSRADGTGKYLTIDLEHCSDINYSVFPMTSTQQHRCIGTWEEGGFTFTVISTDSHDKSWVLRQQEAVMLLLGDPVATVGEFPYIDETSQFIKLELLQTEVTNTLCVDAMPTCSEGTTNCDGNNRHFCQLSCELCNTSNTCQFDDSLTRSWLHVKQEQDDMLFTDATISINSAPTFNCQEKSDLDDIGIMYTLFDVVGNGCYPSVHCVLIKQVSPSMVLYNGLQTGSWPDQWMSQSCAAANVTSPGWQVMAPKGEMATVSCGLNNRQEFQVTYSATSDFPNAQCDGAIYREICNKRTELTIEHKNCDNEGANLSNTYACLGSIYTENVRLTLLADVDNLTSFSCLARDDSNHQVTLMPAEYCSPDHHRYNTTTASFTYGPYTSRDDGCSDFNDDPNVPLNTLGDPDDDDPSGPRGGAISRHRADGKGLILSCLLIVYYHVMGYNYRISTLLVFSVHMFVLFTILECSFDS